MATVAAAAVTAIGSLTGCGIGLGADGPGDGDYAELIVVKPPHG
jgi:hypothetical protein